MSTKIEWTEKTWNPFVGCSIVSAGCKNCYAMRMAARLEAMGQAKYTGTTHKVNGNVVWTGGVNLDEDALNAPLGWRKSRSFRGPISSRRSKVDHTRRSSTFSMRTLFFSPD